MTNFKMEMAKMKTQIAQKPGFIAALDQSGGSTPQALASYGIAPSAYDNDAQMYKLIHQMRTRIIKSPKFNGEKVIGAILFEQTMARVIDGIPSARYLWDNRGVVPFLKIDKGLAEVAEGVQLMNPMPQLDELLTHAVDNCVFGTKMRSNILAASKDGIAMVVAQQFEIAQTILARGLTPIIEPEVNIKIADKAKAEAILRDNIRRHLGAQSPDKPVMLKLTLPETGGFYSEFVNHPSVLRVVALSGGYSLKEANRRLEENPGMIASFSRALTEGLSADQSDAVFNDKLGKTIDCIYDASCE